MELHYWWEHSNAVITILLPIASFHLSVHKPHSTYNSLLHIFFFLWRPINIISADIESILADMNTTELVIQIGPEKKKSGPFGI